MNWSKIKMKQFLDLQDTVHECFGKIAALQSKWLEMRNDEKSRKIHTRLVSFQRPQAAKYDRFLQLGFAKCAARG